MSDDFGNIGQVATGGDEDPAYRPPCGQDLECDTCGEPMIGIMRYSKPLPRTTCVGCGGKSIYSDEEKPIG